MAYQQTNKISKQGAKTEDPRHCLKHLQYVNIILYMPMMRNFESVFLHYGSLTHMFLSSLTTKPQPGGPGQASTLRHVYLRLSL
jgi:hypothetical protein